MILLDTHIWVWWINGSTNLSTRQFDLLTAHEPLGLAISAISCWEVAKLVERGRLAFDCSLDNWMDEALKYPGIQLIELSPRIAIESTRLPVPFHRDPADQIIVATARIHSVPLLTADKAILSYPHVDLAT